MDQPSYKLMESLASEFNLGGKVLDVGSLDVNGCYRPLFADYTGTDVVAGKNVDVVQPSHYEIPFPDGFFDSVVSGQMMEHCRNPFRIFAEMVRVLKSGGIIAITVPWYMHHHGERHYLDCWRFSPDAFLCLSEGQPLTILKNEFVKCYNPNELGTAFVAKKQ